MSREFNQGRGLPPIAQIVTPNLAILPRIK